jgi:hypothetical protein
VTPEATAGAAMTQLVARLRAVECVVYKPNPCRSCANCLARVPLMADLHRLAALYPDAVPQFAPKEVLNAVKAARSAK